MALNSSVAHELQLPRNLERVASVELQLSTCLPIFVVTGLW